MLEIHYAVVGEEDRVKTYDSAQHFIDAQMMEVPDLQDDFRINKVILDGKPLELTDATVGGLFNQLHQ